jgi:hypothetical protein
VAELSAAQITTTSGVKPKEEFAEKFPEA